MADGHGASGFGEDVLGTLRPLAGDLGIDVGEGISALITAGSASCGDVTAGGPGLGQIAAVPLLLEALRVPIPADTLLAVAGSRGTTGAPFALLGEDANPLGSTTGGDVTRPVSDWVSGNVVAVPVPGPVLLEGVGVGFSPLNQGWSMMAFRSGRKAGSRFSIKRRRLCRTVK